MATETEKAYAAGVIDGEGTIGVWRERRAKNSSGYRYRVAMEVSNTNEKLIDWLQQRFGGFKAIVNAEREGCKRLWKWRSTTSVVLEIVKQLLPYLVLKQEQAELVIEFCELQRKYDQRPGKRQDGDALREYEALWERGKTLNRRGVL